MRLGCEIEKHHMKESQHLQGQILSRQVILVASMRRVIGVAIVVTTAGVSTWLPGEFPAPPDRIAFEDIALRSGIKFVLQNSATPEKHQIEPMVSGIAVFDYNNDGRPDLYFVNGAQQPGLKRTEPSFYNRLYRNDPDGTFSDVTSAAGVQGEGFATGVAAGDYDNDRFVDLFIAGVNQNLLYRNRGDGRFENVTAAAGLEHKYSGRKPWSISAGWFDYDADGDLDLFVVNYCEWIAEKEPPCTVKGVRTYCHPKYLQGLANQLYRNNGDGTFTDISASSGISGHIGKGMALSFLDYDRDGKLDVFVTNDTLPNFLFRNEGDGKFREQALSAGVAFNDDGRALSSMGVDARDVDNDGLEDVFVVAIANETFPLFRNLGKGLFADITYPSAVGRQTLPFTGWSNGIYDLNNDGYKDLLAACGSIDDNVHEFSNRTYKQANLLLANQQNGRFLDVSSSAGRDFQRIAANRGAAFGDFDLDGKVDVVVSRIGEPAAVFRNTSPSKNHWLALRLRGRRSNRDALGAMIHVTGASGREQCNRVTTATGYGSASDKAVFFGMGRDAEAQSIRIQWPSGAKQTLSGVKCERYLTVEEP
jgi:hypothetical protein